MTAHCKLALIYVNGPRIEFLGSRFPKQLMSRLCAKSGHRAGTLNAEGPLFGGPSNALPFIFFLLSQLFFCLSCFLLFLFIVIAPVLTSITPIRASNAHG